MGSNKLAIPIIKLIYDKFMQIGFGWTFNRTAALGQTKQHIRTDETLTTELAKFNETNPVKWAAVDSFKSA